MKETTIMAAVGTRRMTQYMAYRLSSTFDILALFRIWGSGFRVPASGFRIQGSGFRVQALGYRVKCFKGIGIGVEGFKDGHDPVEDGQINNLFPLTRFIFIGSASTTRL